MIVIEIFVMYKCTKVVTLIQYWVLSISRDLEVYSTCLTRKYFFSDQEIHKVAVHKLKEYNKLFL